LHADEIRFGTLKEGRSWYYVEYTPPMAGYRFSLLNLSIVTVQNAQSVAAAMEEEAQGWMAKYPVPVMVTAFTQNDSVFRLADARPSDFLIAWPDSSGIFVLSWELVPDEKLPDIALDREYLRELFASVPIKTGSEMRAAAAAHVRQMRFGWWLVFVWAVVVPIGVAVVEWWSDTLGLLVLGYAFVKAAAKALRLTGRLPKSAREKEREAEEALKQHHHYHCVRNPKGFQRLKAENFEREAVERTLAEAAALNVGATSETRTS
jgi:hypothetical protein